ncbi:hypothetical protein [Saccharicrinis aurantiacus]|uniref:hypothetical protein n=1 Tax=Saccharicrinis aurantiacus TaxID=1849719 RepID=UPI00094FB6FC|nr:hypothetical protein [Saccharicrinis aurantiacus]
MKKVYLIISLLAIFAISKAQEFEKMRFSGYVGEQFKNKAVQYGAIKNVQTGEVALSDFDGAFSISGTVGDTLKFRCMGYKATEWVIPGIWTTMDDTIKLKVNTNIYALDEIEVVRYYSYAHFKQAFKDLRIEETEADKVKEMVNNWDFSEAIAMGKANAKMNQGTFGLTLSTGGKDKVAQKREEIKQLERLADESAEFIKLTSRKNVKSLTGYDGTCLDSFMVYLNSNYKMEYTMPQYDLLATIVAAADNFEFTKGDAPWYQRLID